MTLYSPSISVCLYLVFNLIDFVIHHHCLSTPKFIPFNFRLIRLHANVFNFDHFLKAKYHPKTFCELKIGKQSNSFVFILFLISYGIINIVNYNGQQTTEDKTQSQYTIARFSHTMILQLYIELFVRYIWGMSSWQKIMITDKHFWNIEFDFNSNFQFIGDKLTLNRMIQNITTVCEKSKLTQNKTKIKKNFLTNTYRLNSPS